MAFHKSAASWLLAAAVHVAACGDSGSGGSNQGGAGGSTTSNQGGVPNLGGAGGSASGQCATAQMEQNAKYAECGIDIGTPGTGGSGGGPMAAECTASLAAQSVCLKDCVLATPCGGLDGSDEAAATAFSACTIDC